MEGSSGTLPVHRDVNRLLSTLMFRPTEPVQRKQHCVFPDRRLRTHRERAVKGHVRDALSLPRASSSEYRSDMLGAILGVSKGRGK